MTDLPPDAVDAATPMTADSVPAPMVQAAANVCEHFYAWFSPAGSSHGAEICTLCHYPNPAWLDRIHAATPAASDEDTPISADHLRRAVLQWASRFMPGDRWDTEDVRDLETALGGTVENRCHHRFFDAASVSAADILALADKWDRENPEGSEWIAALIWGSNEIRALVAAAEQADKGEATDTPRDDEDDWPFTKDRPRHLWEGNFTPPAAPPEPQPDAIVQAINHHRIAYMDHRYVCARCEVKRLNLMDFHLARCQGTARVPVNDEAEAQTAAEVWHKWVLDEEPALPPEWWDITRRAVAAGFRAARLRGNSDE